MEQQNLCKTCKVAPPAGLIGRTYYVNCLDCVEANDRKRAANRAAKRSDFAARIAKAK